MRVLFLGTPAFAVPSLQALIDSSYDVCGVFTQPDRPSGRGHRLQPGPVKVLAQAQGIPVFQPEAIKADENRALLDSLNPDCIVTAAYGQIIPVWLLERSRLLPVNVHASILPRYRGAAPIPWAIWNGDSVSGVTTMVMEEALDAGGILLQEEVPIPMEMTMGELTARLAEVGARLLVPTLRGLHSGTLHPKPQDAAQVTWAPRITKDMAPVAWDKGAWEIHNQIRAMNPWPVANTRFREERLNLWRSLPVEAPGVAGAQETSGASEAGEPAPGTLLAVGPHGMRVQCGQGTALDILEVQRPGKGRTSGRDFVSGARVQPGVRLFY